MLNIALLIGGFVLDRIREPSTHGGLSALMIAVNQAIGGGVSDWPMWAAGVFGALAVVIKEARSSGLFG